MTQRRLASILLAVTSLIALATRAHAVSPGFVLSAARAGAGNIRAVDQFDGSGNLLREIPIEGFPRSLTTDRFGNLYVLITRFLPTSIESSINKYDSAGRFVDTIVGQLTDSNPLGLNVDAMDRLYLGDNGATDRVFRYTLDGDPLGLFATVSTLVPGATFSLEFDSAGRLYVPDSDRIERFSATGASLGVFAMLPAASSSFITELGVDSLDNVYASTLDNAVYVFNPSGVLIDTQQRSSTADSAFAFDSDDVLYQAGDISFSAFIQRYAADGTLLGAFASSRPGEFYDIDVYEPIPEPSAVALFALAAIAVATCRRSTSASLAA